MTVNGNSRDRATRALDRILNKPRAALLGWQKSDSEIVITAPGGLGRVYITLDGARSFAVNRKGVPLAPRLPILVVPGFPNVIVDIDSSDMAAVAAVFNDQYGTLPHPLSSHQDVLLTTLSNDEVLAWDATAGKWVNVAQAGALVTSVNTQTGAVVLDSDDIAEGSTNLYLDATNLGTTIAGESSTVTILDTDKIPLVMGTTVLWAAWSTVKSLLTTLFDGLYVALTGNQTVAGVKTFTDNMVIGDGAVAGVANLFLTKIGAALMRINSDTSGNPESRYMLDGSTKVSLGVLRSDGTFRLVQNTSLGGANGLVLDASGNVGWGTEPQGKHHIHDNTAGELFVSKTGVNGTAQTIIPDGTGDVLRHCFIIGVLWATDNSFSRSFAQGTANNSNFVIFVDSPTNANGLTFAVSSAGALTIQRTSGSKTYTFAGKIIWL